MVPLFISQPMDVGMLSAVCAFVAMMAHEAIIAVKNMLRIVDDLVVVACALPKASVLRHCSAGHP